MPQAPDPNDSPRPTRARVVLLPLAWALRGLGYLALALQRVTCAGLPQLWRGVVGQIQRSALLRSITLTLSSIAAIVVLAALLLHQVREAPASPAPPTEPPAADAPKPSDNERSTTATRSGRLDQLRRALRSAQDRSTRLRAASAIAGLREAPLEDLLRQLQRATPVAAVDYKNVLRAVGALVPDSRGVFPPDTGDPVDWLAALAQLDTNRLASGLDGAYREAIYSVSLMRAASASRRPDAAPALLLFAYRHGGAFRDECGRLIRSMAEAAIPALVRARSLEHPQAHRIRRYAHYQLDRLNRASPDLALANSDQRLKAEIIHAYGETRHPTAVDAVIARTNDPAPGIRQAARWATMRYLSGPEPKVQRRKLRLSGGRTTERELTVYLNYRQLARRELARALASELSNDSRPGDDSSAFRLADASPVELAGRLFAVYDRRRRAVSERLLARALLLANRKDLRRATRSADGLLADDPEHPRRHELAPIYRSHALELLSGQKYQLAVRQVNRAVHLTPRDTPESTHLRALRLVCEALRDGLGAPSSEWRLERALRLAPDMQLAHDKLARLHHGRVARAAALVGLFFAAVGALGFVAARRRRRTRKHDHVR